MKTQALLLPIAVLVGLLIAAASRAGGSFPYVGVARGTSPGATCLEPLGPDQAELYARDLSRSPSLTSFSIDGVIGPLTGVDWDPLTGAWQAMADALAEVTITHYPRPAIAPMTEHHGMVLIDSEARDGDIFLESNRAVEIPNPAVRRRAGANALSWPPLPAAGSDGACQLAGEVSEQVVMSWNVYRLLRSALPPSFSSPEHYLCGPDLDCTTVGDNGFVANVPNTPSMSDGLLHYMDAGLSLDDTLSDFVYVIQPVELELPTGDANGDTIPDEDLNADGIPEFVDPSGTGRGLTGRVDGPVGFTKPILISTDSLTLKDVVIYVRKVAGSYEVSWDPLGAVSAQLGNDFHAGMLSDLRDPLRFAARDRLSCNWPDGPGMQPLADPGFASGNRYYLMSVAFRSGDGRIVDEYGTDSLGVEHSATSTPPPCR